MISIHRLTAALVILLSALMTVATPAFADGEPAEALAEANRIMQSDDDSPDSAERVRRLLETAQALDDGAAEVRLGLLYEQGVLVPQDLDRAIGYYRDGRNKGSASATFHIARHMLPGGHLETDEDGAYRMLLDLKKRVLQDLPSAKDKEERDRIFQRVGPINGLIGPLAFRKAAEIARGGDREAAFPHYYNAATSGVQEAQIALGYMFRAGVGGASRAEDTEALWFRNAARCTPETMGPPRNYKQDLCDQADRELQAIKSRRLARDRAAQEATYKVLGLIGLAMVGLAGGEAAAYDSGYRPPDIDQNAGIQMAAELMWLGKW